MSRMWAHDRPPTHHIQPNSHITGAQCRHVTSEFRSGCHESSVVHSNKHAIQPLFEPDDIQSNENMYALHSNDRTRGLMFERSNIRMRGCAFKHSSKLLDYRKFSLTCITSAHWYSLSRCQHTWRSSWRLLNLSEPLDYRRFSLPLALLLHADIRWADASTCGIPPGGCWACKFPTVDGLTCIMTATSWTSLIEVLKSSLTLIDANQRQPEQWQVPHGHELLCSWSL